MSSRGAVQGAAPCSAGGRTDMAHVLSSPLTADGMSRAGALSPEASETLVKCRQVKVPRQCRSPCAFVRCLGTRFVV